MTLKMETKNFKVNFKSKLDECISNIVKQEGYTTYNVINNRLSADGGNFLGELSEIDIKGETDYGYKETAIFCKMMTPDPVDMGFISLQNVYNVELFVYKELSQVIKEIQDEANIPVNERFNMVKCYDGSYEQALFMDNLSRKGYKTWYRMDVVSLDMAEVCIKQLARFHGISHAIKKLKPNYFDNKIESTKTAFIFNKPWQDFVEKFYKLGIAYFDDDIINKMGTKIRNILDKLCKYLTDASSQYVLCHGDYRPNNILIKEKDGKIVDAVTVDYQLAYYGCPIIDLLYFIYMSTDYDFRKAHMNYLKDLYYDSLDTYLRHFNISVDSVFSRKVFDNLFHEMIDYGIMVTFVHVPFLFMPEDEDIPDFTKESMNNIDLKIDKSYKDRTRGIIQEFVELGVL